MIATELLLVRIDRLGASLSSRNLSDLCGVRVETFGERFGANSCNVRVDRNQGSDKDNTVRHALNERDDEVRAERLHGATLG